MAPALVMLVISEDGKHGRRNLYTFVGTTPVDGHRTWTSSTPHSHTEKRNYQDTLPVPVADNGPLGKSRRRSMFRPEDLGHAAQPPTQRPNPPTRDACVHLADGVDISWSTLTCIFDAMSCGATSAGSFHLSISEIKVVVSQLGSRIAMLSTLDDDQRRLAEAALYSEIRKRCSNV